VVSGPVVEERVAGAGVDLDVARDAVALEFLVELASGSGGEILFGVGADDGAGARDGAERAWVHAVERSHDAETLVGTGPGDRKPATHAEADRPEPRAIYSGLFGEDAKRRFEIPDATVAQRFEQHTAHNRAMHTARLRPAKRSTARAA
jgi:hypothetical protein